eukprot:1542487-Pleurochrysis_carterae.AAC.1
MRAWIEDLLRWLPTQSSNYVPLMKHGYIIVSHGKVAVVDSSQAQAIATSSDPVYTLELPSPRIARRARGAPITQPALPSASTPSLSSTTHSAASIPTPPVRPLSASEKD